MFSAFFLLAYDLATHIFKNPSLAAFTFLMAYYKYHQRPFLIIMSY